MFSRRNKIIFVLLGLVLLFYYFYEIGYFKKYITANADKQKVFNWQAEAISGLEIIKPDMTIKLEKHSNSWQISYPLVCQANQSDIDTLIYQLLLMETKRLIDDGSALSTKSFNATLTRYGLNKPSAILVVHSGESTKTIAFGALSPSYDNYYTKIDHQNKIYLVSAYLKPFMEKTLEQFRQNTAIYCEPAQTVKISFKTRKEKIELRKIANEWQLVSPLKAKADANLVSDLLWNWGNSKITKFLPCGKPEGQLFGELKLTMELNPSSNAFKSINATPKILETVLQIYTIPGNSQFYLGYRPEYREKFYLEKIQITKMSLTASDFVDRHIVSLPENELTRLDFRLPGAELLAQKHENIWKILHPYPAPHKEYLISNLLSAIQRIKYSKKTTNSYDLKIIGLEHPIYSLNFYFQNPKIAEQIFISKSMGKYSYLMKKGEPTVYQVESVAIANLTKTIQKISIKTQRTN